MKMVMLTKKQMQILSELRRDSRQHISKIARKLNMPLTTAHDQYKILNRYIDKYTTIVDFGMLGYGFRVNFVFKPRNSGIKKIINGFLLKCINVNSIYTINDSKEILVECVFRNISEAYDFKEILQQKAAGEVGVYYIIEEIKKEGFLQNS